MLQYVSEIKFACPKCTAIVECEVAVPEPDWAEDKARDRMVQDDITIECPNCNSAFEVDVANSDGEIYMEFPEHGENAISCSSGRHVGEIDDMDFWDSIPDSPYDILRDSISSALQLLAKNGDSIYVSVLNRMVFVHCFGALEAYLADTLINTVRSDPSSLANLLDGDKDLKDKKCLSKMYLKIQMS